MKKVSLVLAIPVLATLAPVRVVLRWIGTGLSTASLVSALRAMEKETPSRTVPIAALRFAGVIRYTAPIWSSAPQRPQLESCFCRRTKSAAVESGPAPCAAAGIALRGRGGRAASWPIACRRDVRDSVSDMPPSPCCPLDQGLG